VGKKASMRMSLISDTKLNWYQRLQMMHKDEWEWDWELLWEWVWVSDSEKLKVTRYVTNYT